jgi:hypothetical protein
MGKMFFVIYVNNVRSKINESDLIYIPCTSKCYVHMICSHSSVFGIPVWRRICYHVPSPPRARFLSSSKPWTSLSMMLRSRIDTSPSPPGSSPTVIAPSGTTAAFSPLSAPCPLSTPPSHFFLIFLQIKTSLPWNRAIETITLQASLLSCSPHDFSSPSFFFDLDLLHSLSIIFSTKCEISGFVLRWLPPRKVKGAQIFFLHVSPLTLFISLIWMRINFHNSEWVPMNLDEEQIHEIPHVLSGSVGKFPIKYLGVPLHFKKLKREDLQPVVDKLLKRCAGWRGKLLAYSSRLTLIKSYLASIPVYLLSFIKFPKWAIKLIETQMSHCLWKDEKNAHRYHLVSWKHVTISKDYETWGYLTWENWTCAS